VFLPPNATSEYQPLDQGIIHNWKTHVKKQFVMFMAKTFDEGKNLSAEMHVLRAIRWGIQAWEEDVTLATIQSCWRKSQCIDFGSFPLPLNVWTESEETIESIRQRLVQMRNRGFIQSIPNVKDYVSLYSGPWNERIDDYIELEELVDKIVAENTQQEVDEDEEGQVYLEPLPLVSHQEALYALHTLRRYEEAYKGSDGVFLRALRSFERDLAVRYHGALEQVTLDKFWNK
jgi:predicted transcriptional regulator